MDLAARLIAAANTLREEQKEDDARAAEGWTDVAMVDDAKTAAFFAMCEAEDDLAEHLDTVPGRDRCGRWLRRWQSIADHKRAIFNDARNAYRALGGKV